MALNLETSQEAETATPGKKKSRSKNHSKKGNNIGRFATGEIVFKDEECFIVRLKSIGLNTVDEECFGKLSEGFESNWNVGNEVECRIWNKSSSQTGEYDCSYILIVDTMFMNEDIGLKKTYEINDLFYGKVENFLNENESGGKYFNVSHFSIPPSILPCEHLRKKRIAKFLSAKSSTPVRAVVLEKLNDSSYVLGLAEKPSAPVIGEAPIVSSQKNANPEKRFRFVRKTDAEFILIDNEEIPNTFTVEKNHLHDCPWACDMMLSLLKPPLDVTEDAVVLDSEKSLVSMKPSLVSRSKTGKVVNLHKNGSFVGFVNSSFEHGCFVRTVDGSDVLIPKEILELSSVCKGLTVYGKIVEVNKTKKRYVGILDTPESQGASIKYLRQCFGSVSQLSDQFKLQFLEHFMLGTVLEVKDFKETSSGQMIVSFDDGDVRAEIPSFLQDCVSVRWRIAQPKHVIVVGYDRNYSQVLVAPCIKETNLRKKAKLNIVNVRVVYATTEFYVAYCMGTSSIVLLTNKVGCTDKLMDAEIGVDYDVLLKEPVTDTVFLGLNPKQNAKSKKGCKVWTGKETDSLQKPFTSFEEMKKLYPVGKVVDAVVEKIRATFLLLTLPSYHPAKMFIGHFSHQRQIGKISAHIVQDYKGQSIKALVVGYKRFKHKRALSITQSLEESSEVLVLLRNANVPLRENVSQADYPYLYGDQIIENDSFFIKYPAEKELVEQTKKKKNFGCFVESCFQNGVLFRLSPSVVVMLELGLCSSNTSQLNHHAKHWRPGAYIMGQCKTHPDKENPEISVVSLYMVEKPHLKLGANLVGRVKQGEQVNAIEVPLLPKAKFISLDELPQAERFFNCQIVEIKENGTCVVKILDKRGNTEGDVSKETVIGDKKQRYQKRKNVNGAEHEDDAASSKKCGKFDEKVGTERDKKSDIMERTSGLQVSWNDDDEEKSPIKPKLAKNSGSQCSMRSLDPDVDDVMESDPDVIGKVDLMGESDDSDANSDLESDSPPKKAKYKYGETEAEQTEIVKVENDVTKAYELAVLSDPNSADDWIEYMKYFMKAGSSNLAEVREIHERAMLAMDDLLYDERLKVSVTLMEAELRFGTPESLDDCFSYTIQRNNPLEVHLKMAALYDENNQIKKAADTYKLAIKNFKNNKRPWLRYLEHMYREKRSQDAAALVTASFSSLTKQEHLEIIMKTASLEFELGEAERGKTSMEHLISTYPKNVNIWNHYMELLYSKEDYNGVREVFGRLLSIKLRKYKLTPLFQKFLDFERQHGTKEQIQSAQDKYRRYFPSSEEKGTKLKSK